MYITVDKNVTYQTFEGFGASGAWWAQAVGGWTNTDPASGMAVRDRISQLLFSREQGIGLRTYRYNIGGGSVSGKGDFPNPLRRTEMFETSPGRYDFSRDAAAVYMMRRAVHDGAGEVVLFVNSPIERLTGNGKAWMWPAIFWPKGCRCATCRPSTSRFGGGRAVRRAATTVRAAAGRCCVFLPVSWKTDRRCRA